MIELTKKENLEHIVSQFHFLLARPGEKVQSYTTRELADAIKKGYDVDHGDPRLRWVVAFLLGDKMDNGNAVVKVRNFWGV